MRKGNGIAVAFAARSGVLAVIALALASCTTGGTSQLDAGPVSYGPVLASGVQAVDAPPAALPDATAVLPAARPESGAAVDSSQALAAAAPAPADPAVASQSPAAPLVPAQTGAANQEFKLAAAAPQPAQPAVQTAALAAQPLQVAAPSPAPAEAVMTAAPADAPVLVNAPEPAPVKKKSLFASMFGSTPKQAPKAIATTSQAEAIMRPAEKPAEVQLASLEEPAARQSLDGSSLPGVRETALFDIKRRSGVDDDSDIDVSEEDAPVRVASAAGLARLAPNGLLVQTESVDTACLKPALVRTLKSIEKHYGKRIVVTSGYRSPTHNKRVRGARNSLHMYCAAADIQISGVGKWELARYARSMNGRGGVGTYCHTESVHIDVGPERDWNWRCRRSKKR